MNDRNSRNARLRRCWALLVGVTACAISTATTAATITVNSLADDVFPDATGAIFDAAGAAVTLASTKCTLRMAIAAANLDLAVGGANGCTAGDSESLAAPYPLPNGYADRIVFSAGLTGTINVNTSKFMSEAPATYYSGTSSTPTPNASSALVVSRPLVITGSLDVSGVPNVVLDGGLLTNPAANGRLMSFSDGNHQILTTVEVNQLKFQNARVVGASGGCVFSRESVRMTSVHFDNCVAEGDASTATAGGALGVWTTWNNTVSTNPKPHARPDVYLNGVRITNSKSLTGANTTSFSIGGGMELGTATGYVGNVYVVSSTFTGNQAPGFGGLRISNALGVTLKSVSVTNNTATGAYNSNSALSSGFGGGAYVNNAGTVSIAQSNFDNNIAGRGDAGLGIQSVSGVYLTDVTANGNTVNANNAASSIYYGGLFIDSNTTVIATRVQASNNTLNAAANTGANCGGAWIGNTSGTLMVVDSSFSGNTVNNGSNGGLCIQGNRGAATFDRIAVNNNRTTKTGTEWTGQSGLNTGDNTNLTIRNSTVAGNTTPQNTAVSFGASFSDHTNTNAAVSPLPPTTSTLLVENTTISGNTSGGSFAAYVATPGLYTFRNVTIANNAVGTGTSGCGGGISIDAFNPNTAGSNAVQVIVQNSTIARNTVAQCQAAFALSAWNALASAQGPVNGSAVIESSVLGKEFVGSGKDVIWTSDASKVTLTKTLVEDGAGPLSAQCGTNGNLCSVDAKLEALGNNGGTTQTMRLLPGSPAVNAGSNPAGLAFDQRGAVRLIGAAVDMGAYESSPLGGTCTLDMDGDNQVQAFKEGLVLLRSMLGFSAANTVNGTGITQTQWDSVRNNLNTNCGTSLAP